MSEGESPLLAAFEAWWEKSGQYGRAGGGQYEKTFAYNAWVAAFAPALTDDQIARLSTMEFGCVWHWQDIIKFARAIERAYGIGHD